MKRMILAAMCVLSAIVGCHSPSPDDEFASHEKYFVHTVAREGETLALIASWYTGNLNNWRQIEQSNPGMKANRILIGDKVRIPERLMKRRDKLPARLVGGAKAPAAASTEPVPAVETPAAAPVTAAEEATPAPSAEPAPDAQPTPAETAAPAAEPEKTIDPTPAADGPRIKTREELLQELQN